MYCLKCHLFSTYQLIAHRLNKTDLTSTVKKLVAEEDNQGILEYILPESYVAITADEAHVTHCGLLRSSNLITMEMEMKKLQMT